MPCYSALQNPHAPQVRSFLATPLEYKSGTTISYFIQAELSRGTYGIIYLARALSSNEQVVIKVQPRVVESLSNRFAVRELEVFYAATMHQMPHLMHALCSWSDENNLYIVMVCLRIPLF